MTKSHSRHIQRLLCGLLLLLVAYHLPWHTHRAAAFSNNLFDLAEFVSLHPQIQAESPTLYTSLLLRLPIIFIGLMFGLTAAQISPPLAQWLVYGVAALVILRLNPPAIFYPYGGGSANDQQLGKMMLAGLIILALLIATNRYLKPYYPYTMTLLILAGLAIAMLGFRRADDLIQNGLILHVKTGAGLFVYAFISLALLILLNAAQIKSWLYRGRQ